MRQFGVKAFLALIAAVLLCACGNVDPSGQASSETSSTTTTTAAASTTATTTTAETTAATTSTTTAAATTTTTTAAATTAAATFAETTTTAAPATTTTAATTTAKPRPDRLEVVLDTVLYDQLTGRNNSLVGCGPTSAAMLLTSEVGLEVSKDDAVELAYAKKYYYSAGYNFTSGFGVIQEDIQSLLREYGCESEIDHLWTDTDGEIIEKIDSLLDQGHRIILGHRKPDWVLHYAVIYGRTGKGDGVRYLVNDPWGGVQWQWTEQELLTRIGNTQGYDATTVQGLVKGIQWITKLPESGEDD